MTYKKYKEICDSERIVKIEYKSNYSKGVMFIKAMMLDLIIKKFNKAFKDCVYSIMDSTNDEMIEHMSNIRDRRLRRL